MTLLKDNNYKDINVALLSLEADIKNKITGSFDTSEIDKQLAEINSRIDKINAGGGNNSSDEIEDINSKLNSNSIKIRNIEQNVEADYASRLAVFASWNNPYDYDPTNGVRVYVYKITMASWFNSILVQIYDDINYARCRRYVLGLWHVDNYGYSVSVTDLGGTKDGGLRVWMGTDGNIYLQADVYWTSRISFSRLDDITDVTITKIGEARYGSNADINGNVLFTPLADPIVDCGALRADQILSSALKVPQILKTDVLRASSRLVIPIGAPSSLEDGCIWIER